MSTKKTLIKIGLDYLIAVFVVLFVVKALPKLIVFFFPFIIGYLISLIANPIVKFLESKMKIVRKHSSAVIITVVVLLLCLMLYWIVSVLITQAISMSNDMPQTLTDMKEQTSNLTNKLKEIYDGFPQFIKDYIGDLKDKGLSSGGIATNILSFSTASSAVKGAAQAIFSVIFCILSAHFFTSDKNELSSMFEKHIPKVIYDKIKMIVTFFSNAVGGYFKAQFKLMLILTLIMFVTFEVMDVNYSFLISLGIGLLDFLPVFGTGAVLWPWAVYCLLIGNYTRAVVLAVLYIVCQLVKQFLQPKVVGDSIGLSPLATLFLLFFGYKIGGLIGILIAIPVGMIFINLYKIGTFDVLVEDMQFVVKMVGDFCRENSVKNYQEKGRT